MITLDTIADQQETDDVTENKYKLYHCPTPNCIKKFNKYGNLVRHLESGRHVLKPERITLMDLAIDAYSKTLEKAFTSSRYPELDKTAKPMFHDPKLHAPLLPLGWALKPQRTCTRFTRKQRDFLVAKFEAGLQGHKADYRETALEMQNPIHGFGSHEFLTGQQIQSFWSRLARNRKDAPQEKQGEASDQQEAADLPPNGEQSADTRRSGRLRNNQSNRDTRDIEGNTAENDQAHDEGIDEEICDLDHDEFKILYNDPELYIMDLLKNSDCFE